MHELLGDLRNHGEPIAQQQRHTVQNQGETAAGQGDGRYVFIEIVFKIVIGASHRVLHLQAGDDQKQGLPTGEVGEGAHIRFGQQAGENRVGDEGQTFYQKGANHIPKARFNR